MSRLPPAVKPTKADPSQQQKSCEICETMTTVGASHSFIVAIAYATTGGAVAAFQCDAEQHFCCSPECAKTAAHACIDEHLHPKFAAIVARRAAQEQMRSEQ